MTEMPASYTPLPLDGATYHEFLPNHTTHQVLVPRLGEQRYQSNHDSAQRRKPLRKFLQARMLAPSNSATMPAPQDLMIERAEENDFEWCARLMAGSEPWIILRRGLDECRVALRCKLDLPNWDLLIPVGDFTFQSQPPSVLSDFKGWPGSLPRRH